MHVLAHKLSHIHIERAISFVEWALLVAVCAFYAYCIVSSVLNVVLREELLVSIDQMEAQVSELEATYLARSATLTSEHALALGLVEAMPVAYVDVSTGGRLSRAE